MFVFNTVSGNIRSHILHSFMRLHPILTCFKVLSTLGYVSDKLINLGV